MMDIVGQLAGPIVDLVDDLFTSDEEREAAKLKIMKAQQAGKLGEIEKRLSAILAEAKSADPWTSRARPSFLYVFYALILSAVPMGVLHYFDPVAAAEVTEGFKGWLTAIPEEMWWLFGAGYLGYSGARSFDKAKTGKLSKEN